MSYINLSSDHTSLHGFYFYKATLNGGGQQKELGLQLGWKQQGWKAGVGVYISEVEMCKMRQNLGCGMKEIVTVMLGSYTAMMCWREWGHQWAQTEDFEKLALI